MNWLSSIFIGILSGALGLFLTGLIASACVSWYRVSHFEGQAGYFVIFNAIFGGVAAAVIGFIVACIASARFGPGFFKGLGCAFALVILIAGIATLICRLLADIPPKLNGNELYLEVEFRLPATDSNTPPTAKGEWSFVLGSVSRHVQRASRKGELLPETARFETGNWIVPAKVFLFTRRGQRSISLECDKKTVAGFIVPLPARPGSEFEQWSDWMPRQLADGKPWPSDRASYRFRIAKIIPPPPEPDPAVVEAERFAALKPDAPLKDWLEFLKYETPEDRVRAIMNVVDPRAAELIPMIQSTNATERELALSAVPKLATITPELGEALRVEAKAIVSGIEKFNRMKEDEPNFYDVQIELNTRFNCWKQAWWTAHQRLGWDGRPPVKEIHDRALVRARGTGMDEMEVNARVILEALEPKPATTQ